MDEFAVIQSNNTTVSPDDGDEVVLDSQKDANAADSSDLVSQTSSFSSSVGINTECKDAKGVKKVSDAAHSTNISIQDCTLIMKKNESTCDDIVPSTSIPEKDHVTIQTPSRHREQQGGAAVQLLVDTTLAESSANAKGEDLNQQQQSEWVSVTPSPQSTSDDERRNILPKADVDETFFSRENGAEIQQNGDSNIDNNVLSNHLENEMLGANADESSNPIEAGADVPQHQEGTCSASSASAGNYNVNKRSRPHLSPVGTAPKKMLVSDNANDRAGDDNDTTSSLEKEKTSPVALDTDDHMMETSCASSRSDASMSYDFCSSDDEDAIMEATDADDSALLDNLLTKRFDLNKMVKSIKLGEKVLDQVKGRNVVLVVGKTGSGKSTFLQMAAGRQLKLVEYECQDSKGFSQASKMVYDVDLDVNAALDGFEIGHGKVSKTACINCYCPSLSEGKTESINSNVIYVDCPGFEDTNGHEQDVATSIMLSEVAKRCKSLRFVVVVNFISLLEDRGGSIRSLLQLVRKFSQDFESDKTSFVFLFSHVRGSQVGSELDNTFSQVIVSENTKSHEICNQFLMNEILHMIHDGTKDDTEVLSVLRFIEKSLKKGFPFVKVLLPLNRSSVDEIVTAIEKNHVRKMSPSHLASHCGLTQSSRLTLTGQLQNSLIALRSEFTKIQEELSTRSFQSRSQPTADVQDELHMSHVMELLHYFEYFNKYVQMIPDVKQLVEAAEAVVQNFLQSQEQLIRMETEKGTSLNTHEFSLANAKTIQLSFLCIEALSKYGHTNGLSHTALQSHVREKVQELADALTNGDFDKRLHERLHGLNKLKVWDCCFGNFAHSLYESSQKALESCICNPSSRVSDILAKNNEDFCLLSNNEIQTFVEDMWKLRCFQEHSKLIQQHTAMLDESTKLYEQGCENMKSKILYWKQNIDAEEVIQTSNSASLAAFTKILFFVEAARKYPFTDELENLLLTFHADVSNQVTNSFEALFSTLSENNQLQGDCNGDLHARFHKLREVSRELREMSNDDCWNNVQSIFLSCIESFKSKTQMYSGEVIKMSQDATNVGVSTMESRKLRLC